MGIKTRYEELRGEALSRVKRVGLDMVGGSRATTRRMSNRDPLTLMAGPGRWGNYGLDVSQHLDQYRHFQGYPYAIIRTIANRIAGQPLRHARKLPAGKTAPKKFRPNKQFLPAFLKNDHQNLQVYTESPILQAFGNPNPLMVRSVLMFNTIVSLETTAKAFWWMHWEEQDGSNSFESDSGKRQPQLWPFPSHWVEPIHTEERLFAAWKVRPGGSGEAFEVPIEEMVYFYHPDPSDPLSAYSPMTALAKTVMADESIEEANRRVFLNATRPGMAIMVGQTPEASGVGAAGTTPVLTRSQRRSLKTILMEEYRGTLNNGMPLILDGFIKDVKRIDVPPNEFDFLNSSQVTQSRLGQGWGVGKASMGETETSNRASSAVSDDHLAANVINPRIQLVSEVMTCWMPRFFTRRTDEVVYLEPAHSIDIDYDLAMEQAMVDRGGMGLNEWRERHGLPRLAMPEGVKDRTLVGGEWVPIYLEGDPDAKRMQSGSQNILQNDESNKPRIPNSQKAILARRKNPQPPRNTVASVMGIKSVAEHTGSLMDQYESRMTSAIQECLTGLAAEPVNKLSTMAPDSVSESTVHQIIDRHHWARVLKETLLPLIAEAAMTGATSEWVLNTRSHGSAARGRMLGQSEKGILPTGILNRVTKFVRQIAESAIFQKIVGGVVRGIQSAIGRAKKEDTSPVSAAIEQLSDPAKVLSISSGIAQQQSQTSVGGGQAATFAVLHKNGRAGGRVWKTMRDDRVRPAHKEADGQVIQAGEQFVIGGHKCDFPGDPLLPPELRFGCRCIAVTVE